MNAYPLNPADGARLKALNRRHQRWMTRHPIGLQECADRRPLLQQSRAAFCSSDPQPILLITKITKT